MVLSAATAIPLSEARVRLSVLADPVRAGAERTHTKHVEMHVARIDAQRLDDCQPFERERIHLLLIAEAGNGPADVAAGKRKAARSNLSAIRRRRAARAAGCGCAMRREDVMAHHLLLYAGIRGGVVLLSIRQQRQLAFDSQALWPARP